MLDNESLIQNINLEGFEIVQGQMFKNERRPMMTMYKNEVSFTREAHRDLNNCAAIQMLIHVENKIVIIMPSTSTDENAIAWDKQLKDTSASKFFCPCLTNRLYALWDWNTKYKYKTDGRIVYCDKR